VKLTAFLAALLLGTTAMAQTAAPAAPTWTFALHGFVSMSAAYQTGSFALSEGQQSLSSNTVLNAVDKNSLTFDVRQSRFNFSVKGPQVLGGATPSGVLEIDFFQGFGAGNYGNVSLLNRMRVAYSELNWGAGRLQLGQQNDLIFAMAPTSLSHIGFPLGYFTGNIGWRRPGVFGYYTVNASSDLKFEVAGEVGRSQWADAAATIGAGATAQPGGITQGEASGGPAVEARVSVAYSKYLTAFVATHWQQADISGYNNGGAVGALGTKNQLNTAAYNGGLKLTLPLPNDMGVVVQGTGFTGKNLAPLIANFAAFNFGNNADPDVTTTGWWAQAGLNLTKEFSLWGFYGMQSIDKADFTRAFAVGNFYENATTNVLAMYRDGGYGLSAEWINFQTKQATAISGTSITANRTAKSDQYMLTANYFF
jgi:hypothetical protein